MPLPEHVHPVDFLHEHRHEVLEKLEALKAKRATIPASRKKPCIFLAFTELPAPYKDENGQAVWTEPTVTVKPFPVGNKRYIPNGNAKPSSIKNMMKLGKFPIGFEFPTDDQYYAAKEQARKMGKKSQSTTLPRNLAAQLRDGDPYADVREYVQKHVSIILTDWSEQEAQIELSGLRAKVEALEEERTEAVTMAELQAKEIEKLKAELAGNGNKSVPKTKKSKGKKAQSEKAPEDEVTDIENEVVPETEQE